MGQSSSHRISTTALFACIGAGLAVPACSLAGNVNTDNFQSTVIPDYCSQYIQAADTIPNAATLPQNASSACLDYTFSNRSATDQANLVNGITPDEVPALYTSLIQLSTNQISNIAQHLQSHRYLQSHQNDNTASLSPLQNYVGGAAGDTVQMGRLGLFLDGAYVNGNRDDTHYTVGYDMTTNHYTLGADYRFSDAFIAGLAYGYSDAKLDYNLDRSSTDNTTNHYLVYGSWYKNNFAVDGTLAYARGSFDTTRNINNSGTIYTLQGSTDNSLTYGSLSGSYDFVDGGWTYGPNSSFEALEGTIDAFNESGTSGWEMSFDKQKVRSQIFTMGGHFSYAWSFPWGVLVPQGRAEWRTQLKDSRDLIVGRFVDDPASSFTITPDSPDSDWYRIDLGASAQFAHGVAAFLNYQQILSYANTDLYTITLGARWEL